MKSFFSLALSLVALFVGTSAFNARPTTVIPVKFDAVHFVSGPCLSARSVLGQVAGIGTGGITVTLSGNFICTNKGGNDPAPKTFSVTNHYNKTTGGNFKLNVDVTSLCPNRNWTFKVSDLRVVISTDGDGVVLDQTFAGALAACK